MSASRKILVTSALPNANGSIHLGHLLEHIQTDIWVRFQRLRGNQCIYVCADDTHGTATMLKAEQLGIPAERLIEQIRVEHEHDFKRFFISHDNYYSTHSEENRLLCEGIYNRLSERGYIFTRDVEQLFDPQRKLFLADRFVKGECPNCGSARSIRRQLRKVRRDVRRNRPEESALADLRRDAGAGAFAALFFRSAAVRGHARKRGPSAARCNRRSPTSSQSGSAPASNRGTSAATRRISAF